MLQDEQMQEREARQVSARAHRTQERQGRPHHYDEKQQPGVSNILQQLHDVNENSKVTVMVPLLPQAKRPIQTTGDLRRFWKESYPAVRKDLEGRYPRHEWR